MMEFDPEQAVVSGSSSAVLGNAIRARKNSQIMKMSDAVSMLKNQTFPQKKQDSHQRSSS